MKGRFTNTFNVENDRELGAKNYRRSSENDSYYTRFAQNKPMSKVYLM
jgi:hypothetical protein